jgi:hypothetical protein
MAMRATPKKLSGSDLTRGVALSKIADGAMLQGRAHDEPVLLARRGHELFAIGAICTHLWRAARRQAAGWRYRALPMASCLFQSAYRRGGQCQPGGTAPGPTRHRIEYQRGLRPRSGRDCATGGRSCGTTRECMVINAIALITTMPVASGKCCLIC